MPTPPTHPVLRGMAAALPIALGYFPIAFTFGVAATAQGFAPIEAMALSLIIFAGAAQFLALGLLSGGVPLAVSAVTLIAMNLRHVLYGPALMKADPGLGRRRAWLWSFALTDEVFGAALGQAARGAPLTEGYMTGLGLTAYASWLAGTALGALAGGGALQAYPALQAALEFMLPALFLSIFLSILGGGAGGVIAGTVAVLATLLLSGLVSPTIGILGGILLGAVAGAIWKGRDHAQ